jgi:dTDP-4-dehydrorhamnose reductase
LVVGTAEGRRARLVKIVVTGAGGQLGTDLVRLADREPRLEVVAAPRAKLDVADRDGVLGALASIEPDLVIHAAAWTAVDDCESDPERAWQVNALGCRYVAEGARLIGAHLVAVSTDYVFDGTAEQPYTEWDRPNPTSMYGRSKLGGEREILSLLPDATVARTSWVCGAHGHNMVKTVLRLATEAAGAGGRRLRFVDDQRGCPTFTEDLAGMLLTLGLARRPGLFHVTNQGATTWYGFARDVVSAAGFDPDLVEPIRTADLNPPRPAPRPANSVLDNVALRSSGFGLLPDFHDPLERTVKLLAA